MKFFLAGLISFFSTFFSNAYAAQTDFDGRWGMVATCGPNLGNGRPGFTAKNEWVVKNGYSRSVQNATSPMSKEETIWEFNVNMQKATVNAVGRRDTGDVWEWKLSNSEIKPGRLFLKGIMTADAKKIRDCTIELTLIPSQNSTLSTSPEKSTQSVKASTSTAVAPSATPTLTPPAATLAASPVVAPAAPPGPVAAPAPAPAPVAVPVAVPAAVPAAAPAAVTNTPALVPTSFGSVASETPATHSVAISSTPLESFVESVSGNDLLEIVVLASSKNRDVIKQSIDGNWSIKGDRVCIDIGSLTKPDGKAIPLKVFKEYAQGRKDIPAELRPAKFYEMLSHTPARDDSVVNNSKGGFNGPTPMVSTGVPVKPKPSDGPSKVQILQSSLADGLEAGLAKQFNKKITAYYVAGGTGCMPDAYAVPRAYADKIIGPTLSATWSAGIERGEYTEIASVPIAMFRNAIEQVALETSQKKQVITNANQTLAQSAPSGPNALYSVINVGRGKIDACSVKPDQANTPRFDVPLAAILQTEQFKAFLPSRISSHTEFETIDDLYADLQLKNGRCTVIIGNGPTIAKFKTAIDRDKQLDARLMPQAIPEENLIETYAKSLGFNSTDTYLFARSIGAKDARQTAQLIELGVKSRDQFDRSLKRLNEAELGDPKTIEGLIVYLTDEKLALSQSVSIKKLRAERIKQQQAYEQKQAQQQAATEKSKAIEFPFVAYLSCSVGQQKVSIQACMRSNSIETEIELKNGSDYRMFKIFDVTDIGNWNGNEMVVDLRKSFALKAQNADKSLMLNVVIKKRSDGSILFQKSAAQFGVISVSN